jgi:hypothetical protein
MPFDLKVVRKEALLCFFISFRPSFAVVFPGSILRLEPRKHQSDILAKDPFNLHLAQEELSTNKCFESVFMLMALWYAWKDTPRRSPCPYTRTLKNGRALPRNSIPFDFHTSRKSSLPSCTIQVLTCPALESAFP